MAVRSGNMPNGAHGKQFSRPPVPDHETGVFNPKEYGENVFGYGDERVCHHEGEVARVGYRGKRSSRVGLVRRDGHEMDLDLALRENAIPERRGVRGEGTSWTEKTRTLRRNQSSLGWGR